MTETVSTINDVNVHLRYVLLITPTLLLWTRFIFTVLTCCKSKWMKFNCNTNLMTSVHVSFGVSLLLTDAIVSYGWILLDDDAASPPTLSWTFFWLIVNMVSVVSLLSSTLHVEKWPICWHTACITYTICCMSHVVDGLARGDIPATIVFPCISVILGYFITSYVPREFIIHIEPSVHPNPSKYYASSRQSMDAGELVGMIPLDTLHIESVDEEDAFVDEENPYDEQ